MGELRLKVIFKPQGYLFSSYQVGVWTNAGLSKKVFVNTDQQNNHPLDLKKEILMRNLAFILALGFGSVGSADCIKECLQTGHDYNFCEFACRDSIFHPALKLNISKTIQNCETYEPDCEKESGSDDDRTGGGPWGGL